MSKKLTEDEIAKITQIADYRFNNIDLLLQAFTHGSSVINMSSEKNGYTYERLEFLGDRVLGLLVSEILYDNFPKATEGELSKRFNGLVNSEICAKITKKSGLYEFIRLSKELRKANNNSYINIYADVIESFIAVLYLDAGLEVTRNFVLSHWKNELNKDIKINIDAKTMLQEWAHKQTKSSPVYTLLKREGLQHEPVFSIEVNVEGYEPVVGIGSSKRKAESDAATKLLYRERVWSSE